jgi:hypothetical protein
VDKVREAEARVALLRRILAAEVRAARAGRGPLVDAEALQAIHRRATAERDRAHLEQLLHEVERG